MQVALLAGVPQDVVSQARQFLQKMEAEQSLPKPDAKQDDMFTQKLKSPGKTRQDDSLFNELMNLDLDEMSPKTVLDALYKLKSKYKK